MESAATSKKRKRGRPSNASKLQADASPDRNAAADNEDAHVDDAPAEESRPRKRGRPRKSIDSAAGASRDERREKPARATKPAPEANAQRTKARALDNGKPKKKRGRPSLQDQSSEQQSGPTEQPKGRKRGRPSLQDLPPSEAQNKGKKPSTGTARDGKRSSLSSSRGGIVRRKNASQARGPRTSDGAQSTRSRESDQTEQNEEFEDIPPSPTRPYTYVTSRTRRIRQSAIEDKWSPLTGQSLKTTLAVLQLAHRPILQRLSNTKQRRTHTLAALRLITHRISRKIARGLPFPPASIVPPRGLDTDGGREIELNFESVLDGKQALERQLEPTLHAVEILARERSRMEAELEKDYQTLRTLEARARAQARENRALLKKAHVLVPDSKPETKKEDNDDDKDIVFSHDGPTASGNIFKGIQDGELHSLALQLGGHVDSMRANLQQTQGIVPELARSRAMLQDILLRHLDAGKCETVVLG